MSIHLARDGSALGIFSGSEVREGLASGRFRPDDLAWREGMPAWTPLSSWPEFAAAAPAAATVAASASEPSELPWEITPGLRSLFKSAWLSVARPAVLTHARLRPGSVFAAAYLAVAILFVPVLLLVPMGAEAERIVATRFAEEMVTNGNPQLAEAGQKILEEMQRQATAGGVAMLCGGACTLVLYPLFCGLAGLLLWPALRLQGIKADIARVILAAILLGALVRLVCFPLFLGASLLGLAVPALGILASLAFALIAFGLSCRVQGAALGVSGWRVCFAWVILGACFCGCCCCCCGFLGAMAGGR